MNSDIKSTGIMSMEDMDEPIQDISGLDTKTKNFVMTTEKIVDSTVDNIIFITPIGKTVSYAIQSNTFQSMLDDFMNQLKEQTGCDIDEIYKKLEDNAPDDADLNEELFKAIVLSSPKNREYLKNLFKARMDGAINDWDSFKGLNTILSQLDSSQAEFLKKHVVDKKGVPASQGTKIYGLVQLGLVALNVQQSEYHFTQPAMDIDKYALSYPEQREYPPYRPVISGGTF